MRRLLLCRNQTLPYAITFPTQNTTDIYTAGNWPVLYEGVPCPVGNSTLAYQFLDTELAVCLFLVKYTISNFVYIFARLASVIWPTTFQTGRLHTTTVISMRDLSVLHVSIIEGQCLDSPST